MFWIKTSSPTGPVFTFVPRNSANKAIRDSRDIADLEVLCLLWFRPWPPDPWSETKINSWKTYRTWCVGVTSTWGFKVERLLWLNQSCLRGQVKVSKDTEKKNGINGRHFILKFMNKNMDKYDELLCPNKLGHDILSSKSMPAQSPQPILLRFFLILRSLPVGHILPHAIPDDLIT